MPKHMRDQDFTEYIFLGGKISGVHSEYKEMARMKAEDASLYFLLENIEELLNEPDPLELAKKVIHILGVAEGMASWSEITRLSAILGDTRKGFSLKKLAQKLRKT